MRTVISCIGLFLMVGSIMGGCMDVSPDTDTTNEQSAPAETSAGSPQSESDASQAAQDTPPASTLDPSSDPSTWPRDSALVGTWTRDNNFWSGEYSSTTSWSVTLRQDGSFEMRSVFYGGTSEVSDNSNEQVWRGHWAASNGTLRLVYEDNTYEDYAYYTETLAGDYLMLLTLANGAQQVWNYR